MMQRGDIWWATLPPPVGSGPGGRRPVVVVQAARFTRSRLRTVVVVIISTNLDLAKAPGNVLLPAHHSGLPRDSVANVAQVLTVDKTLLTDFVGTLPKTLLQQIEAGLKLVLELA